MASDALATLNLATWVKPRAALKREVVSIRKQHKQTCDVPMDWNNPEIISRAQSKKNKDSLKYDLRVQESLWIRRYDCGPGRGLNEDWGAHAKSQSWIPVFSTMD